MTVLMRGFSIIPLAVLEKLSNPRANDPKVQGLKGGLAKGKRGSKSTIPSTSGLKSRKQNSMGGKPRGKM